MPFPKTPTLLTEITDCVLTITLNRPDERNAMNESMLDDLMAVFKQLPALPEVRVVVLRGVNGNFCAGGDIKDFARLRKLPTPQAQDHMTQFNRRFGAMLECVNALGTATVAVLEGAVLGGGLGLACVADVSITHQDSSFGMPEAGLGIFPAQIAPFVVARIGISQARRLGVCGVRFDGKEAVRLGVAHFVEPDTTSVDRRLNEVLKQILSCAPNAVADTKRVMSAVGQQPLSAILDQAAQQFAASLMSDEAAEGTRAFIERRKPNWVKGV